MRFRQGGTLCRLLLLAAQPLWHQAPESGQDGALKVHRLIIRWLQRPLLAVGVDALGLCLAAAFAAAAGDQGVPLLCLLKVCRGQRGQGRVQRGT